MKNEYMIDGDEIIIFMNNTKETQGGIKTTKVSKVHLDKLLSFPVRWYAYQNNTVWYVKCNHKGSSTLLHRFLTSAPKGKVVDHKDGNGLNNTDSNMRVVTHSQNTQHKTRTKLGENRGLRRQTNGRWEATVRSKGKHHHIGVFDTVEEAREKVAEARKRLLPSFD